MADYLGANTYPNNLIMGAWRNAVRAVAPVSGNVINLQIYVASDYIGGAAKLCIYADSSGSPGSKLSGSDVTITFNGNGWNVSGSISVAITQSTVYWIGLIPSSTLPSIGYNNTSPNNYRCYQAGLYDDGLPDPYGTPDGANEYCWSVRGEIQVAGPSAALAGTILNNTKEVDIVVGGKVITLTLTGDTWIPE